jgi:hypothetical protein
MVGVLFLIQMKFHKTLSYFRQNGMITFYIEFGRMQFMKYLLKVAEFHIKPGSQDEMYYTDDKGELFIGPKKDVIIVKTYLGEVRPKRVGGHYYRIISWCDFPESS